jgi:putative transposase
MTIDAATMSNYRRVTMPGGTWFFTVVIADREQSLLTERIDALRAAWLWVRQRHPFTTEAVVILPDHLHAIWTLPQGDAEFPMRWKLIKEGFSRRLP